MKKTFILVSALLFLMASTVHGQITQTNTQFPNPGFEKWINHACGTDGGTNANQVPYNWHTFDEANASFLIEAAGGTNNHHHSVNYSNSTSEQFSGIGNNNTKYIGIICRKISSKKANGALSTGQTKIALSTNPQNNGNYNFTNPSGSSSYSTSGHFTWAFVGCPDSMSFHYYTDMQNPAVEPLFKVYLHQNGEFRDRADGTLYGNSSTNLIGSSVDTFSQSSSWKREVHPFSYSHPGTATGTAYSFLGQTSSTHPTYGYYTTLNQPTYMLASFSTDKTAGAEVQSVNDALYIDELWCIYDKGLASLTIGGVANSAALNTFNAAEYATHEPTRTYDANGNPVFNNSGSATWTYRIAIPCNNIPQVSATPKSKLVSQFTIMQATAANGYKATIYVKHNDNSEFYYYIQFTPDSPTITLNDGGTYTACEGDSITITASGASTYSWSNGLGSGATVHPTSAGVYTVTGTASNGCTGTATATVTINAIPTAPTLSIINDNGCAVHNGTITVINPIVGYTYTLGNEASGTVFSGLEEGPYTVTVQDGNGCSNSTTATISHVQSTVTATASANTPCAGSDLMLTATSETEGVSYSWSGPNGFTSTEQNPTIDSASAALEGEYTVTVTETATLCSVTDTVYVTVNQPATGIDVQTACGEFTWIDNNTYNESTNEPTYTIENGAANGCDSIVTLHLTINQPATGVDVQTAYGEFTWIDNVTYTESTNEPTFTIENGAANGCDSIVTLNLTINHQTNVTQTIALSNGTNWVSFYVETNLDDLKAELVAAVPGTAITIQDQNNNTKYNPNNGRWSGRLNTLDVAYMYMITVASDCEITLEGSPINPADHPVEIKNGATWIGFPLTENMTPANAFAGFAVAGDKVQSQSNNASYNGTRWSGRLTTLEPGKGYIYHSQSEMRVLTFPGVARR